MKLFKTIDAMIEIMRPRQWVKNVVVGIGVFFALMDQNQARTLPVSRVVIETAITFILFCIVSSAVYIMNDLHDINSDRAHPEKRNRPLAAGRLSPRVAVVEYFTLLALALVAAGIFDHNVAICIGLYFVMQTVYTYCLKNMVLVDVIILAMGFMIRVYSGTLSASVRVSSWMLICAFMALLFVGLCKRRAEKHMLGEEAGNHRKVLKYYTVGFLDQLISSTGAATIICYSIYTLSPETVKKFGTERMIATIPFVIFGVYRYMYLTMCKNDGGYPEMVFTKDIPMIVNVVLYICTCILIIKVL